MAIVTYSCTKCIPIDRAIIDAYRALKAMDDKAQANEEYRKNRSNADHDRALADHGMYESDHSQAGDDHFYAAQDRQTAAADHAQAQADHTQAQHDHGVAQEDHEYIESLDFSEFARKDSSDLLHYYTKSQVDSALSGKADASDIPTKTSELQNDSGFVTGQEVSQTYETKADATAKETAMLAAINGKQDKINDLQTIRDGAAAGATAYQKPSTGIPASDIASGVIPDVSQFITKSVNDLVNYYKKTETYTKTEVDNALAGKTLVTIRQW